MTKIEPSGETTSDVMSAHYSLPPPQQALATICNKELGGSDEGILLYSKVISPPCESLRLAPAAQVSRHQSSYNITECCKDDYPNTKWRIVPCDPRTSLISWMKWGCLECVSDSFFVLALTHNKLELYKKLDLSHDCAARAWTTSITEVTERTFCFFPVRDRKIFTNMYAMCHEKILKLRRPARIESTKNKLVTIH